MSETIFTSETNGDWGTATIWSTNVVPDSGVASVTIATDVTIASGESFTAGILDVAAPDLLNLAGSLDVTAGAMVAGGLALDGGSLNTGGGLTLDTPASFLGGNGTVGGSIDNAGLIFAADGLLDLSGSVSGSGPLEIDLATGTSATLELGEGGTDAVAFVGLDPSSSAQGVLKLDQPGGYSGTISGFGFGEAIDLAGLAPGSLTANFSGNPAQGTLTIANGGSTVASLNLAGDYTHSSFTLVSDGHGGTDVELVAPASATAVAAGDWNNPAIWSTDVVPDSVNTAVTIAASVTIAAIESFVAGAVSISTGGLDVIGSLSVTGLLTLGGATTLEMGFGILNPASGLVSAGSIRIGPRAEIEGVGTVVSSGTLTNDGEIRTSFGELTLASAGYQQGTNADLVAIGGNLILAPTTGPAGFANLVNGTLSGGAYAAEGGTLILPGPITEIANASVSQESGGDIEAGGMPIEDTLGTVGSAGFLFLSGDFATANILTIADGVVDLEQGTLSPAELILATGSSELTGSGTISSSIENNGHIFASANIGVGGGFLDLAGSVAGNGILELPLTSALELGSADSNAVTFDPLRPSLDLVSALQLDDPGAVTGVISGFAAQVVGTNFSSDTIELPGFAPGTLADIYNGTTAGGVLDILAPGSIVASLTFAGDYTSDSFHLGSDGRGGTRIELAIPGGIPCFARGTRIAAPDGEVAVEDLRVGDRVLTASGDARPVVWIGQRRVDCRRHPRPNLVHPVRIRAGAFADNQPVRDLILSPDHALFHDGVLIPVGQLINGASIVQERAASVHYFHIELDRHDVVLAEGLAAESYLNTGNRGQFENGAATISLFADFTPLDEDGGWVPRLTRGPIVEALGRQLWQRAVAQAAGQRTSPEVRVEVDGRVLRPAVVKGRLHRFLLPAQAREAHIVSPDGMRLGGVLVDGRIVELGNPGRIVLPAQFGRSGAVLLELLLHDAMPSRLPATAARAA